MDGSSAVEGDRRFTLLTGVTGFLGRELLRSLLSRDSEEQIFVLVRASRGRTPAERVTALLARLFPDAEERAEAARRVHSVEWDLSSEDSQATGELCERLAGRRVRIIHGAASVEFSLPIAKARSINVGGTERMLALAHALAARARFERFAFVSTAFVAGARSGVVYENELDVGQEFTNTYERSKCEAETLVRSHQDRLPVSVFRPSIVAGHSGTGETSSFKVLYWPLKAFARRLVVCIPGDPEACYDIVPVDYVSEALLHILEREDSIGGCFHLSAGSTVTLDRAVQLAAEFFNVRRIPPYVSPQRFYALIRPILYLTLIGPARRVLKTSKVYIPYLSRKLQFDNREAQRALEGSGLVAPDMESYLKTVFRYAKDSDWGKRASSDAQST